MQSWRRRFRVKRRAGGAQAGCFIMSELPARENLSVDQSLTSESVQRQRWSDPSDFVPDPDNSLLGGFGPLAVGAGVLNFLAFPLLRASAGDEGGAVLGAVTSGVILGEVGSLTLWLVFGPGELALRLLVHWTVAFCLFLALGVGFVVAAADGGGFPGEALGAAVCSLPMISLAAQLPLWPLRTHFGWRVERRAASADENGSQALSIRDLFFGTVVTAVSLACLRLTPHRVDVGPMFWLAWCIGVASVAGISAVSLIPALLFVLRSKETTGVSSLCIYTGLAACVAMAILTASTGGPIPVEVFFIFGLAICAFATALAVPLLMVRSRGYRLTFPSDRRQVAAATLAAESATAIPPAAGGHPAA